MYDLAVIGGGPAGYRAAERAGAFGLKVILFEKKDLGGVCLNEGCIPSKALLHTSKMLDAAQNGRPYGIDCRAISLDYEVLQKRKKKVIAKLQGGIKLKLRQHAVTLISAEAKVLAKTDDGFKLRAGDAEYQAHRILIATGSKPVIPNILGLNESIQNEIAVTSSELLGLIVPPKHFVVIGGGVVGIEMAAHFSALGSKVTILEKLAHIGGALDTEISGILRKSLEKKGIEIHSKADIKGIDLNRIEFCAKSVDYALEADKVLISVGRKPNVQGLGLEKIGIKIVDGAVVTDACGRTNVEGIWAAGDVNGRSMLAHTAYREAEVCAHCMSGHFDEMSYAAIPNVIFTSPEIASVGLTSEQAAAAKLAVKIVCLPLSYSGRYTAETERGEGMLKLIIDENDNYILGAHIIGSYAAEIIYGLCLMVQEKIKIERIQKLIFPHPTVGEIIKEALLDY